MKESKRTIILLLAVLTVAIITSFAALRAQNKDIRSDKANERLSKWPAVDYDSPESLDPVKRAKRREKNKSYNSSNKPKFDPASPLDRGALNNEWGLGLESSLPSGQSIAIIVGQVVQAQAYLSEDKANVYSEFTVQIEDILKNDNTTPIRAGDAIITERQGGRVRFPSGRVEGYLVAGQAPPQVGARYVFFLGFNPYEAGTKSLAGPRGNMSRHILTAYEIREGRIYPLDTSTEKNFQEHLGKDATSFLDEIRRSLTSQSSQE